MLLRPFATCLIATSLFAGGAALGCEMVPLTAPARLDTLSDRQPTLTWRGDPARRYRLQVAALLPEARVLASHDVEVVGTSFRLPVALPMERAAVKVLVSRDCPKLEAQDIHALGPAFFVDTRAACAIDPNSLKQTTAGLEWGGVARAQAYNLRLFAWRGEAGSSLLPLQEVVLKQPQWSAATLPDSSDAASRVATVQAVCDGLPGRPVAWPLPAR
jgi:hypothetical protein